MQGAIIQRVMPYPERVVLTFLSVFGGMSKKHLNYALKVLCGHEDSTWYLDRMQRHGKIFKTSLDYYMANPRAKEDTSMDNSLWVLLQYADKFDITSLQKELKPSGVGFIAENKFYKIVSTGAYLSKIIEAIESKEVDDINYIIVVKSKEEIKTLPKMTKKHMFAIVDKTNKPFPKVTFLVPKKAEKDVDKDRLNEENAG